MSRGVAGALAALLLLAARGPAQDEGGRDTGQGLHPVLFVRWQRSAESKEIYDAAWRALEPHPEVVSRRRLADFEGDREQALAYFTANRDASLVVAFDEASAAFAPEGAPVLLVGPYAKAHVRSFVDRTQLANLFRLLHPAARRVAVVGASREEPLPGFETKRVADAKAAAAGGYDLVWVPEESTATPESVAGLDRIPVVSSSEQFPAERAALTVRPDPGGLGLCVAALIVRRIRDDKPFEPLEIQRLRVTVDLRASRRAHFEVPLALLARADVVRRSP